MKTSAQVLPEVYKCSAQSVCTGRWRGFPCLLPYRAHYTRQEALYDAYSDECHLRHIMHHTSNHCLYKMPEECAPVNMLEYKRAAPNLPIETCSQFREYLSRMRALICCEQQKAR